MKKLFVQRGILILFLILSSVSVFAQIDVRSLVSVDNGNAVQVDTVRHVVERRETLASIAEKYSTTEAEIIRLNPEAAQFIYVGMELVIFYNRNREKGNEESLKSEVVLDKMAVNKANLRSEKSKLSKNDVSKTYCGIIAGYSMVNYVGVDVDFDIKSGFHVGLIYGYNITTDIFIETGFGIASKGYKERSSESSGDFWIEDEGNYETKESSEMNTLNVEIPLYVGLQYEGFFIKVGPYFNYAVSGKYESGGSTTIFTDIHSSETGHNSSSTKISKLKDYNNFNVGFGISIGYRGEHFIVSGIFQRGLTKVYDRPKQYEQNILLLVGYVF